MSMAPATRAVVWEATPSQWSNAGYFALCVLFCWLVVPLFMALWRYLATRSERYRLTEETLVVQSGLLSRRTDTLEIFRIKDLAIEEALLQRIVGTGNVLVYASDRTDASTVLRAVPRPQEVLALLRDIVDRARSAKGVRELDGGLVWGAR